MTTIQAWQHIYSNVEKEQSPRGRGGFQTLFYTHAGLTEAEVEEMEGRLLYFPSKTGSPVKRLFFSTSTGKMVIAQIVPVAAPDQYGRGGRYLAHSFIFSGEEAKQFQIDPFRLFRQISFIGSVDEALAQGNFETGDIPASAITLPDTAAGEMDAAQRWSPQELKKLALLALRANQQAQARDAITVTGAGEQIEAALEAAFLPLPRSMRPQCSFDTYFYHCNLVATYFWAIGLPEPPVSVKFAHVAAESRQVRGEINTLPDTSYERWVLQTIDGGKPAEIARDREHAFAVSEWLDGREYNLALLNAASPELIETVFECSPQAVRSALQRRVSAAIAPELGGRAADYIYPQLPGAALYRHLRQGFQTSELPEFLYQSYRAEQFRKPPGKERDALESLLQKTDHKMLRLFLAYWNSPKKELPNQLKWADAADYRLFCSMAMPLKLMKPLQLLVPGQGAPFLDVYFENSVKDMPNLVEALLEAGEAACLPRLAPHVPGLSRKELNKIAKLIEDQSAVPDVYRDAVTQAIAALPPARGIKGVLKSVWGKLPGR